MGRTLNLKTHRLVRQLHLWICAWGAIAAILFGISGFVQNHRGIMKLPQGDNTEVSSVEMEVPGSARESPEAMRNWLRDTQHIDVEMQRGREGGGGPGGGGWGAGGGGGGGGAPKRGILKGENARTLTKFKYVGGPQPATVHKSENSALAILNRLHKGV